MNKEVAYTVLNYIKEHPEEWDQSSWCGTACCIGGTTVKLFDEKLFYKIHNLDSYYDIIEWKARRLLGLTRIQAANLFSSFNDIEDLEYYIKQYTEEQQ